MQTLQFLTITNQAKYNILQIHSIRQIFKPHTKLMLTVILSILRRRWKIYIKYIFRRYRTCWCYITVIFTWKIIPKKIAMQDVLTTLCNLYSLMAGCPSYLLVWNPYGELMSKMMISALVSPAGLHRKTHLNEILGWITNK